MTPLWSAEDIMTATGGRGEGAWQAFGISIDSRSVQMGDLFIALSGPNFDGHDFVAQALERGAAGALVSRAPDTKVDESRLIFVDDTLGALWRLGAAARARSSARFIGVTGSAGKTGSKEALAKVLSRFGTVGRSLASFNNHWGLPLSLARMDPSVDFGVFELGMNHAGELKELTRLLRPEVALITTIAPAHLAFFRSLDEIAAAKAEIFESMDEGGVAVINRDIQQYEILARRAESLGLGRILSFGSDKKAQVQLLSAQPGAKGTKVEARVLGQVISFTLSLPGPHWVMNALGVLGVVAGLGLDPAQAAPLLADLDAIKGRGARARIHLSNGPFLLIDESYNANPASMRAALAVLAGTAPGPKGRRIAVLGDMLELGDKAQEFHRDLVPALQAAKVDLVFACGTMMAALCDDLANKIPAVHRPESSALAPLINQAVRPGDVVLVKGSLGSRMAQVIESLEGMEEEPMTANGNNLAIWGGR